MTILKTKYTQLKTDLANVKNTARLAVALPQFFRRRITLQQAQEGVKKLLDTRVERFLELARAQIYARKDSPYRALLKRAGCEFADLQTQVRSRGLQETLVKLAGEGVYFTADEFKGKTPVVRGKVAFRVSPNDFGIRDLTAGTTIYSSGTRNAPIKTYSPVESQTERAMGEGVFLSAHGLLDRAHAVYEPVIAGRLHFILINGKLGIPTERWFSFNMSVHGALEAKYHEWNARLVALMGRWFGSGVANPQYLAAGDFKPVVDWVREKKLKGIGCCITTVVSNATRIARVAMETRCSLEGTSFIASGEPLTHAKKQLIEQSGARVAARCGIGEGIGALLGCGSPDSIDEMHVPESIFALFENPRVLDFTGSRIHPLMITTLQALTPRFLLNVENGDYATMLERNCGCALQRAGFTRHIHTIRSFEKFTSEGVNYSGTDLFELLENSIPAEFGGAPGDYQLVEEEDGNGQSRLTLMVHPSVGDLDEENLISRLQRGLAQGSRNHRFMTMIWRDAGTFRIKREAPLASARGKILPLHIKH